MADAPHFDISAAVVRQLGEELVSDEVTAIVELVKNAYDADATYANVVVNTKGAPPLGTSAYSHNKGYITIDDDGFGMSEEDIRKGWLMISLSAKRTLKAAGRRTPKGRTPLGDKGLGRLSTQKLGRDLDMVTRKDGTADTLRVSFSWDAFDDDRSLRDVPVSIDKEPAPGRKKGTQLVISGLRNPQVWEGEVLEQLTKDLSQIISPYPEARSFLVTLKIDGRSIDLGQVSEKIRKAAIGRFIFSFKEGELTLNGSIRLVKLRGNKPDFFDRYLAPDNGRAFFGYLKTKVGTEILNLSKSKTHFVDFEYKVNLSTLGGVDNVPCPKEPAKLVPADPGPFSGEIDEFLLRSDEVGAKLGGLASATELRSIVKQQAGIKVFRNGFGIKPYGINAQDWLKMGQSQTSGGSYYGLRPDNVLGFVLISEENNSHLKEKTDREGFVSNQWSRNFLRLVSIVPQVVGSLYETIRRTQLLYEQEVASQAGSFEGPKEAIADASAVATRMSEYTAKASALRQQTDATRAKLRNVSERINKAPIFSTAAEREVAELLAETKSALDASTNLFSELEEYTAQAKILAGIVANLAPRLEVLGEQLNDYSELAGLGLLAETLSHEVQNQTDRLMLQASNAAKKGRDARPPNSDLVQFTRDVTSTVSVLRALMAHLGPSLRYQRDRVEKIEISSLLKEIRSHFKMRWESSQFECKMTLTGSDFDIETNRGRIVQVIDNVLLNSEYWLKELASRDSSFNPEITIDYEPYRLRFWDNGPGIDQSVEFALFEPFVTLKPKTQGRGLGLFIATQIMDSFGGSITLLPDRNSAGRRYIFELDLSSIGNG